MHHSRLFLDCSRFEPHGALLDILISQSKLHPLPPRCSFHGSSQGSDQPVPPSTVPSGCRGHDARYSVLDMLRSAFCATSCCLFTSLEVDFRGCTTMISIRKVRRPLFHECQDRHESPRHDNPIGDTPFQSDGRALASGGKPNLEVKLHGLPPLLFSVFGEAVFFILCS